MVELPAAAAFAARVNVFALSALSPKPEIISYNPSVKSCVVFPTAGERSSTFSCSSFIRAVAPGISVATRENPSLNLFAILTLAAAAAVNEDVTLTAYISSAFWLSFIFWFAASVVSATDFNSALASFTAFFKSSMVNTIAYFSSLFSAIF